MIHFLFTCPRILRLICTLALVPIGFWLYVPGVATHAADNTAPIAINDPERLFAISPYNGNLHELNPITFAETTTSPIILPGFTVTGANGIARHPTTGRLYAILKLAGMGTNRHLVILDPITSTATDIGGLGDSFASIAFTDTGVLYGVTGDGATVPETLYTIDPTTAAKTLVTALGNGSDGEVIGFNPDDGLMYHASGGNQIFETIDLTTLVVTPIARTGFNTSEIFSLQYRGNNTFWATDIGSRLSTLTTTGVATFTGITLADDFRGLFSAGTYTVTEDLSLSITPNGLLANDYDAEADPLTAVLDSPPAHAASFALASDGTFSYTPLANYCGPESFTYHASDGLANSAIATAIIDVLCVPDAPQAEDDTYTLLQNSLSIPLAVLANDSDDDADPLAITAIGTPSQGGSVIHTSQVITYTPVSGFFGTEVLTYTIDDGTLLTDTATVTLTVDAPPVATNDDVTVSKNSQANILTVLANDTDPEGDPLTITAIGTPDQGGSAATDGITLTYTPASSFVGTEVLTYTITDGILGTATASVTLTVVNNAPIATSDRYTTTERTPLIIPAPGVLANDTDSEGDPLTAVLDSAVTTGTLTLTSDGAFSYRPPIGWSGTATFTYHITDGQADSASSTVTIVVVQNSYRIYLPVIWRNTP